MATAVARSNPRPGFSTRALSGPSMTRVVVVVMKSTSKARIP